MSWFKSFFSAHARPDTPPDTTTQRTPPEASQSAEGRRLHTVLPQGWPELTVGTSSGKVRVDGLLAMIELTTKHGWTCEPKEDFYVRKLTRDCGAIAVTMVFRRPGDDLRHPLFVLYDEPSAANPDAFAKHFPYYREAFEDEPGWGEAAYIGDVAPDELPWRRRPRPEPIGFIDLFQFEEDAQDLGGNLFALWQRLPDDAVWYRSAFMEVVDRSMRLCEGYATVITNLLFDAWTGRVDESEELSSIPAEALHLKLIGPEGYPVVVEFSRERGIQFLTPNTAPAHYRLRLYEHWVAMLTELHSIYRNTLKPFGYEGLPTPLAWWESMVARSGEVIYPSLLVACGATDVDPHEIIPPLPFDPGSVRREEVFVRVARVDPASESLRGDNSPPHVRLTEDLVALFAADRESHFQALSPEMYAALGEPAPHELLDLARENLKRLLSTVGDVGYGMVNEVACGLVVGPDSYRTSMLILEDYWERAEETLGGDLAVCVPDHERVVFAKWTDTEAREKMREMCFDAARTQASGKLGLDPDARLSAAQQLELEAAVAANLRLYRWGGRAAGWCALEL